MAKKQSSNERDMENMLDMLKRSVENEDDTDADYADEDINTGSDDEDFDAYLANLIGKQISDIDSDIPEISPQSDAEDDEAYFDEFDEITEESAVDDKIDDVADDVPFDTVEETVIEEDIEEILEEKFEDEIVDAVDEEILSDESCDAQEIEELVQNEASADDYYAEEEIDEAAEEAAYLAYLATLTAQDAPDSSIQQIADEKESFDEIEDVIDEPVEEEIFEDIDESVEEEIFEDIDESVEEEIFEDVDGEIVEDFQEESDEPFVEIPEHIVIDSVDDFSDNAIEPISENQEDAADIAFVDEESIDEDIEEVELPIYSVERQRQIKQSRVESDSAVELEDEDVERLMGLGYERELVDQIGLERYEKIRRKIAARGAKRSNISGAFATDGDEFVSKSQVKPISEKYHKERTSLIIRLLASSFVALLILIFNEPSIFGVDSFFGISYISKPWMCSLVGLQLLLVAIAISYRFMYEGILKLVRLEPDKYSPIVLCLLVICVYDVAVSVSSASTVATQYNLVGVLLLIYAIIGDFIRYRRELLAFRIAASSSRKYSLVKMQAKKEKYKTHGKVRSIVNDSKDDRVFKIQKMILPIGFFKRVNSDSTNHSHMNFALSLTLVLSSAMFAFSLMLGGSTREGMSAFMVTTLACMPVSTLIYRLYPFFSVSEKIGKHGCTILGESDVEEYSGKKTLLFDDKGFFFGRANTEILFKSSSKDITKYIRYSKYIFDAIGGTLAHIIENPTDSNGMPPEIEFTEISETGVVAIMGGQMSVVVGDTYYLKQHGVSVSRDCEERTLSQKRQNSIIYLAFDGKVKLGYEFEYIITKPFEKLLAHLDANDTSVAICTKDPNVNEPFLARSRDEDAIHIGVIKENSPMSDGEPENIDCGIIALDSENKITTPIIACEQLRRLGTLSLKIRAAIYAFGILCATLLCAFGVMSAVNSLFIIAYQALCTVPIFIVTSKKIKYEEFMNGTKAKRDTQVGK